MYATKWKIYLHLKFYVLYASIQSDHRRDIPLELTVRSHMQIKTIILAECVLVLVKGFSVQRTLFICRKYNYRVPKEDSPLYLSLIAAGGGVLIP